MNNNQMQRETGESLNVGAIDHEGRLLSSTRLRFLFGAATSAYQAEGGVHEDGRIPVSWDREFHFHQATFNADITSDFYHTFDHDFALAQSIGLQAVRISIAWSRIIMDKQDTVNPLGLAFYDHLIDSCLAHGIEPFVTLHHFDTPLVFFDEGDWLSKSMRGHFLKFARVCFDHFGRKVRYWITINEPWSVACGQYIVGHFPPHIRYDIASAVQAMHAMMISHAECASLYKSMGLGGYIGIVHILESKYPLDDSPEACLAAKRDDALANRFLLDATLHGGYCKETLQLVNDIIDESSSKCGNNLDDYIGKVEHGGKIGEEHNGFYGLHRLFSISDEDRDILCKGVGCTDFLGVNYYTSHFLMPWYGGNDILHNGTGRKGTSRFRLRGIGERLRNQAVESTSWDWPIHPDGLRDMLSRLRDVYGNPPVYITENGLGACEELQNETVDDAERIEYLSQHLAAVLDARKAGADIRGYFIWSLFDLLSWTNGYSKRYGLFYTDFSTGRRYPKHSALWLKEVLNAYKSGDF